MSTFHGVKAVEIEPKVRRTRGSGAPQYVALYPRTDWRSRLAPPPSPRARARAFAPELFIRSFVYLLVPSTQTLALTALPPPPRARSVPLLVPPLIPSLSSLLRPPITPNPRWQRRPPVPLLSTFCPPSFASPQALAHKSFLVQRPRGPRCNRRCRVFGPSQQTVPLFQSRYDHGQQAAARSWHVSFVLLGLAVVFPQCDSSRNCYQQVGRQKRNSRELPGAKRGTPMGRSWCVRFKGAQHQRRGQGRIFDISRGEGRGDRTQGTTHKRFRRTPICGAISKIGNTGM